VGNTILHTGIQNVKVVDSKITISPDKLTESIMQFIAVNDVTLENNTKIKIGTSYSSPSIYVN